MKKILSTVAALGLVAGMATAAQALEFKVSGYYFVEGTYMSSADGSGVVTTVENQASGLTAGVTTADEAGSDAYWNHEFVIKPMMKVNDKIVMKSKIYLASDKFGGDDAGSYADGENIDVHHLFMEYMSPIGKVRVGRTSAGLWQGDFMSSDSNGNRIMYFPNFMPENWGSCVFLQKKAEGDSVAGNDVDSDHDYYEVSAWYKTKDLVVALGLGLTDDATVNTTTTAATYTGAVSATTGLPVVATAAVTNAGSTEKTIIKGYYNQNFGNVYSEVEFALNMGDIDYDDLKSDDTAGKEDMDIDNFALMADVGMTMDKLDVGMMFIYASGDDDATDTDSEAAGALGEQFQPYTILTGRHTGMFSQDFNGTNVNMTTAGLMSLGAHADFAVNDKLSLHSALVYAQASIDEMTPKGATVANDFDEEYGWEIDLGISYALMDNLTYSVDFGYLMAGDFFQGYDVVANVTTDAEDVMVLNHRLTMEF